MGYGYSHIVWTPLVTRLISCKSPTKMRV
jgi:hypothetical protein